MVNKTINPEQVVLSTIPVNTLIDALKGIVEEVVNRKQRQDLADKLLSPEETCNLFNPAITKVTLWKWEKQGRLIKHRIGGRVYFKYSEVMGSLETLKRYSRPAVTSTIKMEERNHE